MSESVSTPAAGFYDKVATKFGGYHAAVTRIDVFPEGNLQGEAAGGEWPQQASPGYWLRRRRFHPDFEETYRVLRPGGVYLEITIGEHDARALKQVFGRGQYFGLWDQSVLERHTHSLQEHGFDILDAAVYDHREYYPTAQDFDTFLQSVPIVEDDDSEGDRPHVDAYASRHMTDQGIELERQRVVIVARKPESELGP